jgi:hypothetical protein
MNAADPASELLQKQRKKWPLWRIILTYVILLAIAFASIWFIDRRVDALAEPASGPQLTR